MTKGAPLWAEKLLRVAFPPRAEAVQPGLLSCRAEYGWILDFNPKEDRGDFGKWEGAVSRELSGP